MSNSLQPHELQHVRLPCPSLTPRACSYACPCSWWCHLTISSSVAPFSSCLQSFPALVSFPRSQFFASGGQSIGASVSASVLPMNIQDWFPLGYTCKLFIYYFYLGTQASCIAGRSFTIWVTREAQGGSTQVSLKADISKRSITKVLFPKGMTHLLRTAVLGPLSCIIHTFFPNLLH